MFSSILIAEKGDNFRVGKQGDFVGFINRIKVRDQRDCQPIMPPYFVVTADYYTRFFIMAAALFCRRIRAYVGEIDSGVAGCGKGTKVAVRFFQQ